jgi:hypothetical protein
LRLSDKTAGQIRASKGGRRAKVTFYFIMKVECPAEALLTMKEQMGLKISLG